MRWLLGAAAGCQSEAGAVRRTPAGRTPSPPPPRRRRPGAQRRASPWALWGGRSLRHQGTRYARLACPPSHAASPLSAMSRAVQGATFEGFALARGGRGRRAKTEFAIVDAAEEPSDDDEEEEEEEEEEDDDDGR